MEFRSCIWDRIESYVLGNWEGELAALAFISGVQVTTASISDAYVVEVDECLVAINVTKIAS